MSNVLEIQLEDYSLGEELERDDLTLVYRGRRNTDEAIVAIKIVAPQFTFDEFFVRRFQELARQTTKLEHPNIVRTYETGQKGSILYLVQELITARPLAQVIEEEGSFTPYRMLNIARQIASALDYAHQKSITHGDLSTNRVYLDEDDRVTVTNFGQLQAMAGTSLVKQGYAFGSPEVTAPERVHGQGPSRQSDLYSLGILCYQMLAGVPPFTGTPAAVLHAQAYEQPRPLHLVDPDISVPLSEAISRMLAKGLELRYNTGAEAIRALAVAIEGTAPVRSPVKTAAQIKEAGLAPRIPWWKRSWIWILAAILVVLILLVLGFWLVSAWQTIQPAIFQPGQGRPQSATPTTLNEPTAPVVAGPEQGRVVLVEPSPAAATPSNPTAIPIPTTSPTLMPLPTPGPPTIADDSPFTNLKLAHRITEDSQPANLGTTFAPGSQPVYLFFDYQNVQPGTVWTHRWTWADTELDTYQNVWPETYAESGTAWVFYNPTGGFQPGPYQVTLEINGRTVATATFIIQPGGL